MLPLLFSAACGVHVALHTPASSLSLCPSQRPAVSHNINNPRAGAASFRQAEMTAIRRGNMPGRFTTNLLAGRNKPKTDEEDTGGTSATDMRLYRLSSAREGKMNDGCTSEATCMPFCGTRGLASTRGGRSRSD